MKARKRLIPGIFSKSLARQVMQNSRMQALMRFAIIKPISPNVFRSNAAKRTLSNRR